MTIMRTMRYVGSLLPMLFLADGHAQATTESAPMAKAASPTKIVIQKAVHEMAISPLLLGSQYQYFSAPIRERLKDENLLQGWRDMPVKVLRYPGGTWGDHYNWDNPEGSYYAVGNARSIITPQQFIENCRAVGATPIFQVNAGTRGSDAAKINPTKIEDIRIGASRAAGWVKEANLVKGWNVKHWEIGNETWIWLSPEEYATHVVEYSKAMKAVDPSIKIIACGLTGDVGPFSAPWLKFPDDPDWKPRDAVRNTAEAWNAALAEKAKGHFDYLAPHIYIGPGDDETSPLDRYLATTAQILDAEKLKEQLSWVDKIGGGCQLAVTEWACNFGQSVPVRKSMPETEPLYYYSLGNGLNMALFFGTLVESADKVGIAVLHDLDDIQTLWYWPKNELATGGPLLHPAFLAMKVWGGHLGTRSLAAKVSDVPLMKVAGKDYPALFAYSSEDEKNVYLVAINLSPDSTQELSVQVDASTPLAQDAACTWMAGPDLAADNWKGWNGAAPLSVDLKTDAVQAVDGTWSLKMPAHSMVGVLIHKR